MIVVVPMAGRGTRFSDQGFQTPKPLIPVHGKPMILWALESLVDVSFDKIIFVSLKEHNERYHVSRLLKNINGWKTEFVFMDDVTDGQLCTVLAAENHFTNGEDILIAASDSYIKSGIADDILNKRKECAGLISVISLPGDQWSFAKTDPTGKVIEVAEKRRISNNCSTGLYYFTKCEDLISYGRQMIQNNERTRNEFYVIPVYQKMINGGLEVGLSVASEMWDMGTPLAKELFEKYRSNQNG